MSAPISRLITLSGLFCVAIGCPVTSPAADLVLQKVPPLTVEQAPAYPENLARYHFGAQIEVTPQRTEEKSSTAAALLCDDPTASYSLPSGTTTFVISLSRIENLETISFSNHGAKGNVAIAVSNSKLPATSAQWGTTSRQEINGDVKVKIGPSEAKYVKLTFDLTEPGRIASLGVYSPPTVATFTTPRDRKAAGQTNSASFALIGYNLTNVHTTARAAYVSSGDDLKQANSMIDDQPATGYTFGAKDASPVAVIDLGKTSTLHRIASVFSGQKGNVEFFVLQSLPGAEGDSKTLRVTEADMANFKPVGSVTDADGRAAVDFPETSGRYVMMKWAPAEANTPLVVAEIAAFGGNKGGSLMAANSAGGQGRIESDGKTAVEGKDFKDMGAGKEMPEEGPAEGPPPSLPDPPPFTFAPQIVPTSP